MGSSMVSRTQLAVADIRLESDAVRIMIERKDFDDLVSSISNGHWARQRERMHTSPEDSTAESTVDDDEESDKPDKPDPKPTKFVLLVEGPVQPFNDMPASRFGKVGNKSVHASLIRTQLSHNVHVIHAASSFDTPKIIEHLCNDMSKRGADMFTPTRVGQFTAAANKRPRDGKQDRRALMVAQLTHIDGISRGKAAVIVDAFPSWSKLLAADPKAIADLTVQGRRIGPRVAQRMVELLF